MRKARTNYETNLIPVAQSLLSTGTLIYNLVDGCWFVHFTDPTKFCAVNWLHGIQAPGISNAKNTRPLGLHGVKQTHNPME